MLSPDIKSQRKTKNHKFSSPTINLKKVFTENNESFKENVFKNSNQKETKKTRTSSKFRKDNKNSNSFFRNKNSIKVKSITPSAKVMDPLKKYCNEFFFKERKSPKNQKILKNEQKRTLFKEIKINPNSPITLKEVKSMANLLDKENLKAPLVIPYNLDAIKIPTQLSVNIKTKNSVSKSPKRDDSEKKTNSFLLKQHPTCEVPEESSIHGNKKKTHSTAKIQFNKEIKSNTNINSPYCLKSFTKIESFTPKNNLKKEKYIKTEKQISLKKIPIKNKKPFLQTNKDIYENQKYGNNEIFEIFSKKGTAYINVTFLVSHLTQLLTLYTNLENEDEAFLIIKEYTDFIQKDKFLILEKILQENKSEECVLSLKFEIIAIFIIFYCLIQNVKEDIADYLNLVELVCKNYFIFLKLLKIFLKSCEKNKEVKKMDNFFKNTNSSKIFNIKGSLIENLKKNNKKILTFINELIKEKKEMNSRLILLLKKLNGLSLKKSIAKIFEIFNKLFKEEKIRMQDKEAKKNKKLEEGPDFIIQPFDNDYLLPQKVVDKEYTLFLDLDETLVHFSENMKGGEFFLRPFSREFIKEMSEFYEIIIFTAALKDYADWIIDRIDTHKKISFRLYRKNTIKKNGVYLKDLSNIGRSLEKSLIVDNNPENFMLQPDNGIYIKSWYNNPDDKALEDLAKVLKNISLQKHSDIREGLRQFRIKFSKNN